MNTIKLTNLPDNYKSIIQFPDKLIADTARSNLIDLMKEGRNIDLGVRLLEEINGIRNELIENNYAVLFLQLSSKTAHAHFFLEQTPHKN